MSLYERKKSPWKLIVGIVILVLIVIFACCDFMPKQETIEKTIVHTID